MPSSAKTRLLFMASRDPAHPEAAGGDIQLSALAREMARRGHQVTFVCMRRDGAAAWERQDGVSVARGGTRYSHALWTARRYMRDWAAQVDVVVQEAIGGLVIPYLAALYVRRPLVTFWYQRNAPLFRLQFSPLVGTTLAQLERLLAALHAHSLIVVPSEAQVPALEALGFPASRIRVVPNGLDWPITSPAPLEARDPLVVYLGKLRRYKCAHHLVEAAARLRFSSPEARFVIAGRVDGTGYDRWLEEEIRRRGLGDRVTLQRGISEDAKQDLLRRARALVLVSPAEGFGISVLEANACGTPAVVSEGVPREVVAHEVNGLRVPFGDPGSLTDAIHRLLTDDRSWTRLSAAAWRAAQCFTWTGAAERLDAVVTEALEGFHDRASRAALVRYGEH